MTSEKLEKQLRNQKRLERIVETNLGAIKQTPENKLTPEQAKELWERCGFTIQYEPDTNPNNLLHYAWPMAVEKLKKIAPYQDNAARLFYFWRIKMAEGFFLEEALASMLYEVICDKMTVPKVSQ